MDRRLKFREDNLDLDWTRVVFTDSKYWVFQFSTSPRCGKVWCKQDAKPTGMVSKTKHQVHAYAGLTYYGVTPLFFVTGTTGLKTKPGMKKTRGCNAAEYCDLVENRLWPSITQLFQGREENVIFQQDGAAIHRAKVTQRTLQQLGMTQLEWPPNSPDLSPIETAWAITEQTMATMKISSFEEYKKKLQKTWMELSKQTCRYLIMSMVSRLELVLIEKGGGTAF